MDFRLQSSYNWVMEEQFKYSIYIRQKMDSIIAHNDDDAMKKWCKRYGIREERVTKIRAEWAKGGFRLVVRIKEPEPEINLEEDQ